jgi:hypothetical protein
MKNNILNCVDNYNETLDTNVCVLFLKYITLIHDLIECAATNIYMQNDNYLKHVMIKSIKNTYYIYAMLLLYTKNTELTIHHAQKSILYFIEFISQIGDDNHNFLKLSSKDATLFIYKKTIFDINNDYKKDYKEDDDTREKIKLLEKFIDIYNVVLIKHIELNNFKENSLVNMQKTVFTKVYKIVEHLVHVPDYAVNRKISISDILLNINIIINELNKYSNYSFISTNYLLLVESLIKKFFKDKINIDSFKNKLNSDNIENMLHGYSVCKVVNYLTQLEST